MKKTLSVLLCLGILSNIFAQQPKNFPTDDAGFINTYGDYLSSNNRPQAKEAADWVKKNLVTSFSAKDLQIIKQTANVMLQKKVRLWPDFYNYTLYLQAASTQKNLSADLLSKNHQILLSLLQKDDNQAIKQFTFYYDFLTTNYQNNTIYSNRGKSWIASQPYKIELEKDLPVYIFPKIDLTGYTNSDSLEIKETSGRFYPFTNIWKGISGKSTWKRVGYPTDKVYVTFGSYQLDLSNPEVTIDTATLTFKPYSSEQMKGSFTDKLFTSKAVAQAFPKFSSFSKVVLNLSPEVHLQSGIALEGNGLFATSTGRNEPARLRIYNSKKVKIMDSEAKQYLIRDFKQITADGVKVNFCFFDSTSIFHPSSTISYNFDKKNLKITRENKNESQIPYNAPYFKMILYVDQFNWDIDSNYIEMNSTSVHARLPTAFESFDYYVPGGDSKYRQLLNIDPIESLAEYCNSLGIDRLNIDEVARVWKVSNYKAIEPLVYRMMEDGYMYYDRETGMIDIYNKLFLYDKIKKNEFVNYDNIRLQSVAQRTVGKVLLGPKKLELLGVQKTSIISRGNITMNPTSDTVYVSKNRDLIFKGMLTAGKFNFYADSIQFKYDDYLFSLKNIDSMLIMVPSGQQDQAGNLYYMEINTPIKDISGNIYLADPKNRNGSLKYSKYPYFDCNDTSLVTFDKGVFKDRYPPKTFLFRIYPFVLEKMNTYNTDSIKLKGLFLSDGIMNNIETNLGITKDKTLGLDFSTKKTGIPLYKNMANLNGRIKLDLDGLTAKGTLTKYNLTMQSDSILLLPDSVHANIQSWQTSKNAPMVYPILQGVPASLSWIPGNDSAFIHPGNSGIVTLYDNKATLQGDFQIQDKKMTASGRMSIGETNLDSKQIELKVSTAEIHQTPLNIIEEGVKEFSSGIADIHFNMDSMTAQIKTPQDSLSKYNQNHLLTDYNDFTWNVKNKTIVINQGKQADIKKYEFVENKLKGIQLNAAYSTFNLSNRQLDLKGVTKVLVADSKIIPAKEELSITDGGLIDPLSDAQVIFNTDSAFHTLIKANVEILNKDKMNGSGVLTVHVGNLKKDINIPSFNTIEETEGKRRNLKTTYYLQATGQIEESDQFKLSNNLYYRGKLLFTSLDNTLTLDGFAKSQFKSIPESEWFKIKQNLDIQKSSLSIDSLKNELGQDIYTGLLLDLNDFTIYPRVIQSKTSNTDRPIYLATGFMKSDTKNPQKILFGSVEAIQKRSPYQALMTYDDSTTLVNLVGEFPLVNISPDTLNFYGKTTYDKNDKSPLTIQGTLAMNLKLTSEINNLLARFMSDFNTSGVNMSLAKNKQYSFDITRNISNPQNASIVKQDMESSGVLNIPPQYPYNMVYSDVKMVFDNYEGTFKSVDPLGMLVFAGKPFAQKINAYLEFGPRRDGDFYNMYLSTPSGDWLYIRYNEKVVSIISSDETMNNAIASIKESKRTIKDKNGIVYQVTLSNPVLKDNFVSRMEDFKLDLEKK